MAVKSLRYLEVRNQSQSSLCYSEVNKTAGCLLFSKRGLHINQLGYLPVNHLTRSSSLIEQRAVVKASSVFPTNKTEISLNRLAIV